MAPIWPTGDQRLRTDFCDDHGDCVSKVGRSSYWTHNHAVLALVGMLARRGGCERLHSLNRHPRLLRCQFRHGRSAAVAAGRPRSVYERCLPHSGHRIGVGRDRSAAAQGCTADVASSAALRDPLNDRCPRPRTGTPDPEQTSADLISSSRSSRSDPYGGPEGGLQAAGKYRPVTLSD